MVELEVLEMVHGSPEIPNSTAEVKTSVSQTYQRVFTASNLKQSSKIGVYNCVNAKLQKVTSKMFIINAFMM